jgi:hypothetical protein
MNNTIPKRATITFRNDDASYLDWVREHQQGYVLNVRDVPDPNYVVLHRATCGTISRLLDRPGGYTDRNYRKIVGDTKDALKSAAIQEGRQDGTFSTECSLCRP